MKLFKAIATMALIALSTAAFSEVAVIVNTSIADTVDEKSISKIFLGKTNKLPSGTSITPLNLSEGDAIRMEFDKSALNKSAGQIKSYWSQQMFTGKGKPPEELPTEQEIIDKVKADASFIGYVSPEAVTSDVRVITTF